MEDLKGFIGQGEGASLDKFMVWLHGPELLEVSTHSY